MVTPFDVITMGRIGVDVYPLQTGVSLRHVTSFGKYLGGSSSNVAVAAARYGRKVATITRTGDDPFGEFLHDALQGFGVDDRYVTPVAHLPTPVTFCEIFPPDDFPLYFYREPKAPDLEIHEHELDLDAIRSAKVFWATVTGPLPGAEPPRHAGRARGRRWASRCSTSTGGPMFWDSREEARKWVREALQHVDRRRRQPGRVGDRGRHPRPASAAATPGLDLAVVKRGPARRARPARRRARRGPARAGGGRQRPRRRRRLRRRALPRPARSSGTSSA